MNYIIKSIIRDLHELEEKRQDYIKRVGEHGWVGPWEVLDFQGDHALLSFSFKYSNPDWNYQTVLSVISVEDDKYILKYIDENETQYATVLGLLNVSTNHAICIKFREFDDTVYDRYGEDFVQLIDYRKNDLKTFSTFSFGIGTYHPGSIKIALNRSRNWIAFVREESDGWSYDIKAVAYIVDLADAEILFSGALEGITRVNSIDLPGSAQYLVVTDNSRIDHIFQMSEMGFVEIKTPNAKYKWKVALSFSGKDRHIAEQIAVSLKQKGIAVFYDEFEKANLLGKDLYQYLFEVYSDKSEFCIVLISENYLSSNWTMLELKAMQSYALIAKKEYILPIRIDEAKLPGLPPQIGYLDYRNESIESISGIIFDKITKFG